MLLDLVEEALRADLREILGPYVDLSRCVDGIAKGYDTGMVHEVVRDLRRGKPDIASLAYSTLRLPIAVRSAP